METSTLRHPFALATLAAALSLAMFAPVSHADDTATAVPSRASAPARPAADPRVESQRAALRNELQKIRPELLAFADAQKDLDSEAPGNVGARLDAAISNLDALVDAKGAVRRDAADSVHAALDSIVRSLESLQKALATAKRNSEETQAAALVQRLLATQQAFATHEDLRTPKQRAAEREAREREVKETGKKSAAELLRERQANRKAQACAKDRAQAGETVGQSAYNAWATDKRMSGNTNVPTRRMALALANRLAELAADPSDAKLAKARDAFTTIENHLKARIADGASRPREDAVLGHLLADYQGLRAAFEAALDKSDRR